MTTHSGILAWRIPRTEKPGGLQFRGSNESDASEATEHTHSHLLVAAPWRQRAPQWGKE